MAEVRARESNPDDRKRSDWMAAAQAGDRNAYEALLRDCVPIIKSVARRQGVPADQVDDVVQEVLLSIHRARATYDPARHTVTLVPRRTVPNQALQLTIAAGRVLDAEGRPIEGTGGQPGSNFVAGLSSK